MMATFAAISSSLIPVGRLRVKHQPGRALYMGQKLQDGKEVLEMSLTNLHSKSCPVQTIHPTDLGLLPS